MIKKISKIKNFGVFKDFTWDSSINEFDNINLIYGWNYSGKTTLSRIFRSFELADRHEDFSGGQYELVDEFGNKHDERDLTTLLNFRVFNSDFVKKSLKWHTMA
jgi:wobble nucleotide-excising tRNase